ncbi:MAG: T9SS type A sorting domain-containing protein [Flavobacteriaceae bacterium]|nr:T9SS type A sorting domain-containing protein [Flavobacteriaceae bacterium]
MKQILLFFALSLTFTFNAQILVSNNFNTDLGWTVIHTTGSSTNAGWTRVTTGSAPSCLPYAGAGMAKFASYDIAANNAYTLLSPLVSFTGETYRIRFKMYRDGGYSTDADNVKVYYKTTTTETGTLLGTVNRSMSLSPVVSAEGWYEYSFNLPAAFTGDKYIGFLATSKYGNNIYVDEIIVEKIPTLNVELVNHNVNEFVLNGNVSIGGSVKNQGLTAINSFDVNWSVDGGTVYSTSITGQNIAPGTSYNFSHPTTWNAIAGQHTLNLTISNINGNPSDDITIDNSLSSLIYVASNHTAKMPLYEEFTSSTCGPCASFNSSFFNSFMTSHPNDTNILKYQMSWPAPGDPYYTAEGGVRRAYYGVSGVPSLFGGGKNVATSSTDVNTALSTESSENAYFIINATHLIVGNTLKVNVEVTPYLTGTFKLHIAVIENTTSENVSSNGETSFKNVMMKMYPDASGTTVNFVNGSDYSLEITQDLSSTNVEEMSDLRAVVFIQYDNSKKIMQSTYTVAEVVGVNEIFNSVSVYPNPTTGLININSDRTLSVEVSDVLGKKVFEQNQIQNQNVLDLSGLENGVYIMNVTDGQLTGSKKIIISK